MQMCNHDTELACALAKEAKKQKIPSGSVAGSTMMTTTTGPRVMLVEQARILRSARCRGEQRFGFGFISTLGAQAEPY